MALIDDLQKTINNLEEFKRITIRILNYIPEMISLEKQDKDYIIIESQSGNTKKYARPYNKDLLIKDSGIFEQKFEKFLRILKEAQDNSSPAEQDHLVLNSVAYTIQQSIGIALDLRVRFRKQVFLIKKIP